MWITFTVQGTEKLDWKGEKRAVYRVYADAVYRCRGLKGMKFNPNSEAFDDAEFSQIWWYDIEQGLILKSKREWPQASYNEEYSLERVTYPATGTVAKATPPESFVSSKPSLLAQTLAFRAGSVSGERSLSIQ